MPAFLRLDHEDAAMLTAMLTGDRSYLRHRVRIGFERTGSFHLLVVSGLHRRYFQHYLLACAADASFASVGLACDHCLLLWLCAVHGIWAAGGARFLDGVLYLIGRLLWRERVALNVIGVVALVMLAADPSSLSILDSR